MSTDIRGFFAYPSQPAAIPETIRQATREFNQGQLCVLTTWQECRIGGKIVIDTICRYIDAASVFCADLTGANPNVMFELGYAVARKKRILLFLDTSLKHAKKLFGQLRILTTVGYVQYCNANDIVQGLYHERPWEDLHDSIYAMSIEPSLSVRERGSLLYLKGRHNTEADVRLSACVYATQMPITIDDPRESAVQALVWYAKKILASAGVIVHLCGPVREGAELHNSRYSFIAGIAYGLQSPLLMLADDTYASPIDYRDILRNYGTAAECAKIAQEWLKNVKTEFARGREYAEEYRNTLALAADLKGLRIGEYIAENEEEELENYFIETSPFLDAIEGRHTLVVGRKGSGKTANLYAIASRLREDKRNLVCIVKPASYELESVLRLLRTYRERDEKGYLVESLWKFLLYTEIARATVDDLEARGYPFGVGTPEARLVELLKRRGGELGQEFAVRLERTVQSLFEITSEESVEKFRRAVAEKLHGGVLQDLRKVLGEVLAGRQRVAVLVDNLDKAWDKRNDLECLADFLLGLLRVTRDIRQEFAKSDRWREPVPVTLTIFLRADIFGQLMRVARERDKISYTRLRWDDPEMLLRVVDERLVASRGGERSPKRIWADMFCESIKGVSIQDYLIQHVLPRPRDIVFFVGAAIATAVNRGHGRVEERDILDAEKEYSQFVFDSIQVENGISLPELEAVLYEFAGQRAILNESDVRAVIASAGISSDRHESVIGYLCALSFLGVETGAGSFSFSAEHEETQRNEAIARKMAEARESELRYRVNTPFHAFLEIDD